METYTPIELLKNKLAELKSKPGIDPNLIMDYEKAILILELIGSAGFEDKISESNATKNLASNEPPKDTRPYYERFMEAQKNKNKKPK